MKRRHLPLYAIACLCSTIRGDAPSETPKEEKELLIELSREVKELKMEKDKRALLVELSGEVKELREELNKRKQGWISWIFWKLVKFEAFNLLVIVLMGLKTLSAQAKRKANMKYIKGLIDKASFREKQALKDRYNDLLAQYRGADEGMNWIADPSHSLLLAWSHLGELLSSDTPLLLPEAPPSGYAPEDLPQNFFKTLKPAFERRFATIWASLLFFTTISLALG